MQERINDALSFFENADTNLGFRKLMDCALDTQNLGVFKKVIELTDWKERFPEDKYGLIKKSCLLLEDISRIKVPVKSIQEPIISVRNVTKSYGSNKFSLGPIDLQLKKGQVFGLVGENGNGKTTLLRILAKELSHDDGHVTYNFDTPPKNDFELRSRLAYIPQRTQKWYGSLIDNLKFVLSSYGIPSEENETRVLMMIARLGLWNYRKLKWSELSSGYKMRFELARTLLRQPELLLLDEPLANLDVLAQQIILEDLKSICNSLNNPIALILSSQQLYEVEKVSDNILFLKNGRQNFNNEEASQNEGQLIIEIECNAQRSELEAAFSKLNLTELTFNGGAYIVKFSKETPFPSVLHVLGEKNFNITYIRDISKSTRRFFIS